MASEVLMRISKDEVERARLMSEYKYELDTQSRVVHAKREGKREGIQEGMQKGIQEGERGRTLEIAKRMKSINLSLEQIQAATGLSPDEIAKL